MKRLIISTAMCIFISLFFTDIVQSQPTPPDMDVYYIKFYYGSSSYDALDIRENYSTDVDVPEWQPGISRDEDMAYIKSQTDRKIKVKFIVDQMGVYHYGAYATASGSDIGDVDQENFNFGGQIYSSEILMEFDGTVPSSVGIRNFTLSWTAVYPSEPDDIEYSMGTSGPHNYYTLLGNPQSPMAEPWTEVLDYACDWANGKTNEADALEEITVDAYTDIGDEHRYKGDQTHAAGTTFYLTNFLADTLADCRDISALVHVFTKAIGGSQTQVRMINTTGGGDWFYCKIIKPLGRAWTQGNTLWWFHQIAWKSNVYDPCIRLDQGDTERIAVNEPIDEYESYYNDLFCDEYGYEGDWLPQTPKSYTTIY